MKNITPELMAHLKTGGPFLMADLYTITLVSGTVLRIADFDCNINHPNGYVYRADSILFKRGKTRIVIGVEVDTLDLSIYGTKDDKIDGTPLFIAARKGQFDGSTVVLDRAFLDKNNPNTCIGVVNLFTGRFADTEVGRTEIQSRVNSATEVLNTELPRNTYQSGCQRVLYGAGCDVNKNSYASASTVSANSTALRINCTLNNGAGYFDRGSIKFISGSLSGQTRTIKSYSPGVINLFLQLNDAPVAGDQFIAYPGCDKSQSTCQNKFNNLPKFRGTPYVPDPVTAY